MATVIVAVKRHSINEMKFLINFTGEDAQGIALRGRTLQIYFPKLNTVRVYDTGSAVLSFFYSL